ncbi:hypothetical protein A3I57_00885 [Candidatus Beckwithbacteria bacterium RIFCSPLOWO2_02_FULL_47_23]|uniref:Uncharacterized protein n=2 Tax=Candidatus Beckwithiibacteriota TaxID=1752726 RepID=A0A1F5E1E8_9BACT|nr:MAG: hypothetical protein A3E73_01995 [Candidatus Beckwithbacteria bacterium RIFCSPHIGHO2_12_FULL_47_17]OGD61111.1 MAG: hypothetical protein A3I57_00885 [Candidatus Beckwithbacteria bacterium RIFCSPLOWO2_02_FULL_47_23]
MVLIALTLINSLIAEIILPPLPMTLPMSSGATVAVKITVPLLSVSALIETASGWSTIWLIKNKSSLSIDFE